MKKFYMTMAAMLCGVAAMAQNAVMSAEDFELTADGSTAYLEFKLDLSADAQQNLETAGVKFELPAGVGIAQRWNDADEEWEDDITCPMAKSSHTLLFVHGEQNPQSYVLSVFGSDKVKFKTSTNVFAQIGVKVVGEIANGVYDIPATPDYSINSQTVYQEDIVPFTVKLTVKGGTGINSINADDVNAPIYNVAGQRVSKAQKGVYIQNGKKVAVK